MRRLGARLVLVMLGLAVAALVGSAAPASAAPASATPTVAVPSNRSASLGTTAVTTAPGIAGTLIRSGILPLPAPGTGFGLGFSGGLSATYRFPITGSTANLAGPSGDILHSGGIYFVGLRGRLEIGRFDISLADGTIYATQVNFAPARIPVLTLDLTNLKVSTTRGATVLSGISLKLTKAAADAINATFKVSLPDDGSLVFGSAVVTLRG